MENILKIKNKWKEKKFLVVGLDTDPQKIPPFLLESGKSPLEAMLQFNKKIIDVSVNDVCGFKINSAFYEKYGIEGLGVMQKTIEYIKEKDPSVFTIADAKRGDIENTNEGYKYLLYGDFDFDSLTIHPYLGLEANETFLKDKNKMFFVLAKTSNKDSGEFQDLDVGGMPLYLKVIKNIKEKWNRNSNCGVVVGATYPEHLLRAREEAGDDVVFLVPGVGAQGGDLESVLKAGLNSKKEGLLINMSRSVLYASNGEDFADKAKEEIQKFNQQVEKILKEPQNSWREMKRQFYKKRTLEIFKQTEAVLTDDHFVYQNQEHGSVYVAKDKINPNPILINEVGNMIADMVKEYEIDTVVVPAVGGVVLGHAVARNLSHIKGKNINSVFIEKGVKDEEGRDTFKITRGYDVFLKDKKILVVEDIVNTGYSVKKVIGGVKEAGAQVQAIGIIWNRGNVKAEELDSTAPLFSLVEMPFEKYTKETCPLCKADIPINMQFGHGKSFKK
ncbi:MAG: orotidine-5'-phosphate decarboxylase [Candidatus Pacebacteria bacterium]|nr:orotidine-5'-phosphate decarboxylase [Candidatus Paceibacterota bacterium]MCF7862438.1 orotidine-5'-phosphate decarboxylase [Candidatus Paceibacterota bacterium]